MNILIPMAGPSDTIVFDEVKVLKNLFKFNDKPFLKFFLEKINLSGNLIFITQQEYENLYNVTNEIETVIPNPNVFKLNGFEKGAALTILKLKNIFKDFPSIIINLDLSIG